MNIKSVNNAATMHSNNYYLNLVWYIFHPTCIIVVNLHTTTMLEKY